MIVFDKILMESGYTLGSLMQVTTGLHVHTSGSQLKLQKVEQWLIE